MLPELRFADPPHSARARFSALTEPAAARAALPLLPAALAIGLMILWSAHDGGYDQDTWYWGALLLTGALGGLVVSGRATPWRALPLALRIGLAGLLAYLAFSYLSIAWAGSQGDALTGSNRTLLYVVVVLILALTPWNRRSVLGALTLYALGVAAVGAVLFARMAQGHGATGLFDEGRLNSPAGYLNGTAAMFMATALLSVALSVRRDLPPLVRGLLLAGTAESLQLALLAESRGWLFTLPLVLAVAAWLSGDRLRLVIPSAIAALAVVVPLHWLLAVFRVAEAAHPSTAAFLTAAHTAARVALGVCAVVFVVGAVGAALEARAGRRSLAPRTRRLLGALTIVAALVCAGAGGVAATHGHPLPFLRRQWHGFVHPSSASGPSSSHFAAAGSERIDFWRVALDAWLHHPIGGLGQDNFAEYYVVHRRTGLEPEWAHSIELRLLVHTGIVGFLLFVTFLAGALTAAITARRRGEPHVCALRAAALLPLIVWLIHGSLDWFWEIPALSAPALGFLAIGATRWAGPDDGASLTSEPDTGAPGAAARTERRRRPGRFGRPLAAAGAAGAVLAFAAALVVLAFPYFSVREVSTATDLQSTNPGVALHDLSTAAGLNPLSADPARLAGTIALESGRLQQSETWFGRAISRDPGGWFAWLGEGLAAQALGDSALARRDFAVAASINRIQPAVQAALAQVDTDHPLTPGQALNMLVLAH